MLVSPAYAQAAGGFDSVGFLMPLVLIFVVFWFLLIRPQQQKMKKHQAMLAALRRGDRVVTGGGIVGSVTKVSSDDAQLTIEIADKVKVKVMRSTISEVLSKTEPAGAAAAAKTAAGGDQKVGILEKLGLR